MAEPNSILHISAALINDHGTEYERNPSSYYGGMLEDGLIDGWMDGHTAGTHTHDS